MMLKVEMMKQVKVEVSILVSFKLKNWHNENHIIYVDNYNEFVSKLSDLNNRGLIEWFCVSAL